MCENRHREMGALLLESLECSLQISGLWLSKEDIKEVFDNEDVFSKNKTIPEILEELDLQAQEV